jgi:type II secretion system protein H
MRLKPSSRLARARPCSGSVAAAILGCRRAGLPSPVERTSLKQKRIRFLESHGKIAQFPGGKDAALYVRHGCLTPHTVPMSRRTWHGIGGFTLIELMVVITIIGIITAAMIPEMKGSFQDALLRSTSRELINVFDLAYSRAVSLNQTRRVRLDEKTGRYLVEKQVTQNRQENFVPVDDVPGDKGQLDTRITVEFRQPDEISSEQDTPAAAPALASDTGTVPGGVVIAFYPDGTADGGEILLRDRDGFRLQLQINPVTARVHVVEMEREGTP